MELDASFRGVGQLGLCGCHHHPAHTPWAGVRGAGEGKGRAGEGKGRAEEAGVSQRDGKGRLHTPAAMIPNPSYSPRWVLAAPGEPQGGCRGKGTSRLQGSVGRALCQAQPWCLGRGLRALRILLAVPGAPCATAVPPPACHSQCLAGAVPVLVAPLPSQWLWAGGPEGPQAAAPSFPCTADVGLTALCHLCCSLGDQLSLSPC